MAATRNTPVTMPLATNTLDSEQVLPPMIERLPEVSQQDLLEQGLGELSPPVWLRQLRLENSRDNLLCLRPRTRIVKRLLDVLVASLLLVLSFPLMVLAALVIKLTSRGPIIFTQIRVGLNTRRHNAAHMRDQTCRRVETNFGRPFRIYKFRTMHVRSDQSGPSQAQAGDSRVIPVGRLLRRMRIDELPQLINVLRGEMSMVGPRPECIEYMEELSAKIPDYLQRLGLKPGLTGIAQIEAGYANDLQSYRKKVAFDLLYLQNCCVWNDLRIMARTVKVVFTGFGAL